MWFFYERYSIRKGGVSLVKQKVSVRLEEDLIVSLMKKYGTDNKSEAIRLALLENRIEDGSEKKVKTLFPYIGKKLPRIGREVVSAFNQSGCNVFVDLFCGSLAMLCYLPADTKVVVNDIDRNLTNLYQIIKSRPADFVSEVMKLPYSEVIFKNSVSDLKENTFTSDIKRAVAYYYVRFCAYRGSENNPIFNISKRADVNRAQVYQRNIRRILILSEKLQNAEILNRDFRAVLKMFNDEEVFVYADCPYLGTENYYENVFWTQDHEDLAQMLKDHCGKFALSSKAKKELRRLYRSNSHHVLNFEDTYRLPDKRHQEQLIMNFKMEHVNKVGEDDIIPYRKKEN